MFIEKCVLQMFADLKHTPGETAEDAVVILPAALIVGHDTESLLAEAPTVLPVNWLINLRIWKNEAQHAALNQLCDQVIINVTMNSGTGTQFQKACTPEMGT